MSVTTHAPRALPSILRISASDLAAPEPGTAAAEPRARYRARLSGPAGSGTAREVTLDGDVPHDLVVVEYGDDGYTRTWLRGDSCADAVVYVLLAESPASFPARAPAIARTGS